MRNYNNENNRKKRKINVETSRKIKWRLIGTAGVLATMLALVGPEYIEHRQEKKIESNAEIDAIRKFKNIKKENRGIYLDDTIEKLYEKYPDLDDIIYESREVAGSTKFINDIYRLYKAFMVDKSKKETEDIENITVTTVDQYIFQSDLIKEGNKEIKETHKEQYKMITDSFIEAESTDEDGTKLAKEIYELLALELGLEENVLTSQEIQEKIEKEGIYYDMEENLVYTAKGKGHIVLDCDKEQDKKDIKEDEKGKEELMLTIQEDEGIEPG